MGNKTTSLPKMMVSFLIIVFCMICVSSSFAATVTLPKEIQSIEDETFMGDTSIDEVILPESIRAIGSQAFAYSSISSVFLPSSIEYIGPDAFTGCDRLICRVLPGTYAEKYCRANQVPYESITSNPEDFEYEQINGIKARITRYIGNDSAIVIPDEIDGYRIAAITSNVFKRNNSLTEITLPQYLETIEDNQFDTCTGLTSVYVRNKVESIGMYAFRECTNLKQVVFEDTDQLFFVGY